MSLYKVSATVKLDKNDARIWTKRFQTDHSWFSVSGEAIWDGVLACEQALQGALAAGEKRKESLQLRLWIWIPPPIPLWLPVDWSCQNSADQREAETSTNVLFYRRREEATENKYIYYCVTENTASSSY